MALFDSIISEVASKFGLGDKARGLVSWLLSFITDSKIGGLAGFLGKMKQAGLGGLVGNMMGSGGSAMQALTGGQVESVFGGGALSGIASKLGIPESLATSAIGFTLPKVIGALTPGGVVPDRLPADADALLRNATGAVGSAGRQAVATGRQAYDTVRDTAGTGMNWLWWLLPLIALGLLAFFLIRGCKPAATPTVAPSPTKPPVVPTVPVPDVTQVTKNLGDVFKDATDACTGIKSAAEAEAALPKLTALSTKLNAVRDVLDNLPGDGKERIAQIVTTNFGKLRGEAAKVLAMPGLSDKARTALNEIVNKSAGLDIAQVTKDLNEVMSSMKGTLEGIKDKATAEAAEDKLKDLSAKVENLKNVRDQMSKGGQGMLASIVKKGIAALKALITGLPEAASAVIKPILDGITTKLEAFT